VKLSPWSWFCIILACLSIITQKWGILPYAIILYFIGWILRAIVNKDKVGV